MSARCTSAVFDRYPGEGGEFALALALADNAHEDGGHIYPSVETMAQKSRQSVRSVQRSLRKMIDIGWLQVVRNGTGGRGNVTEYRINPDWLKGANLTPFPSYPQGGAKGDTVTPFRAEKGCHPRQKRVTSATRKGDKRDTAYITRRTVIEPNTPLPPKGGACGFESFFAEYPRQVDEATARRAWEKLAPDEQLQAEIVKAVRAWAKSPEWQREGGRFVPKPGNWLRKERWRDQVGIAAPSPQPAAPPPTLAPSLSPEQLEANKRRAREAVATIRASMRAKAVAA